MKRRLLALVVLGVAAWLATTPQDAAADHDAIPGFDGKSAAWAMDAAQRAMKASLSMAAIIVAQRKRK